LATTSVMAPSVRPDSVTTTQPSSWCGQNSPSGSSAATSAGRRA
jgi:hypothetical protein